MAKPRLYLFHGNDSRASSAALQRWEAVFAEKYGTATRYLINVDELNPDVVKRQLGQALGGQALFAEPKLLIMKRLTSVDKGALSRTITEIITSEIAHFDADITMVVWEDHLVTESHVLHRWFAQHVDLGKAVIQMHMVPDNRQLTTMASKYVAEQGFTIDKAALQWLYTQFTQQEKTQRVLKRLKQTDLLATDDRAWWLYSVLDLAMLHTPNEVITVEALEAAHQTAAPTVAVFELVNAIRNRSWGQAYELLEMWEKQVDEGAYFGLYALLRMHFRKLTDTSLEGDMAGFGLELLAEIEVLAKNVAIPHGWLMMLFIERLEGFAARKEKKRLLPPRLLWLSHLQRS